MTLDDKFHSDPRGFIFKILLLVGVAVTSIGIFYAIKNRNFEEFAIFSRSTLIIFFACFLVLGWHRFVEYCFLPVGYYWFLTLPPIPISFILGFWFLPLRYFGNCLLVAFAIYLFILFYVFTVYDLLGIDFLNLRRGNE